MLDFMVLVLLTLKWLRILWLGLVQWYHRPKKLYKGTSLRTVLYKASNTTTGKSCLVYPEVSQVNSLEARSDHEKDSAVQKRKITVSENGKPNVQDIEKDHTDTNRKSLDKEHIDTNRKSIEKEHIDTNRKNPETPRKKRDSNGYLISDSLSRERSSKSKSKSKSPPIAAAVIKQSTRKRSKSKSPQKALSLNIDDTRAQEKSSLDLKNGFQPLQTSTPSPRETSSQEQITRSIKSVVAKAKLDVDNTTELVPSPSRPVGRVQIDWETRTIVGEIQVAYRPVALLSEKLESSEPLKCLIDAYNKKDKTTDANDNCIVDIETRLRYIVEKRALIETSSTTHYSYHVPNCDISIPKSSGSSEDNTEATEYRAIELKTQTTAVDPATAELGELFRDLGLSEAEILELNMAQGGRDSSSENRYVERAYTPSVEKIRVYERFMEGFTKDVLSAMERRRKSFDPQGFRRSVDTFIEDSTCCWRKGQISGRRSLRRHTAAIDVAESEYSIKRQTYEGDSRDYTKTEPSSRQQLTEGMIRTKISQHMSNIIGQKLYPGETHGDIMDISWQSERYRHDLEAIQDVEHDTRNNTSESHRNYDADLSASCSSGDRYQRSDYSKENEADLSDKDTSIKPAIGFDAISVGETTAASSECEDISDLVNFPLATLYLDKDYREDSSDNFTDDLQYMIDETAELRLPDHDRDHRQTSEDNLGDYLLARRYEVMY